MCPPRCARSSSARGIAVAASAAPDPGEPLIDADQTVYEDAATEEDKASMLQKLAAMSVPEKVKAAMKGTREMRSVLIRIRTSSSRCRS